MPGWLPRQALICLSWAQHFSVLKTMHRLQRNCVKYWLVHDSRQIFHKASEFKNSARYKDALLFFRRAKRAYEKDDVIEGRLRCFMSIGDVYRMTGKFELAGKNYSEAIKISGN